MSTIIENTGSTIKLDFTFTATSANREGSDLILTPEGREPVVVHNYFVAENNSLPDFELPDGTVIDANDALGNFDIDLSTSAQAQLGSSGLGEYSGDFGHLIDGVDRLSSLGPLAEGNSLIRNVNFSANDNPIQISNGSSSGGGGSNSGGGDDPHSSNLMHVLGSTVTEGLPDESSNTTGWGPLGDTQLSYEDTTYFGKDLNNSAIEGDKGVGFPSSSNWSSSAGDDPNIGALYKVVENVTEEESLSSAGVFYKFGLSCDVPHVPGATDSYLQMRGLGEAVFDLSKDSSRTFAENAFGAPSAEEVSESGGNLTLAYKDHISDVLHDICGIEQNIINDTTLNSSNESPYYLNVISTTIEATSSGVIDFGWGWKAADGYGGSAFWVLKDATTGEIVSGGKIAEYQGYDGDQMCSGIINIPVPEGGTYTLSIGTTGSNEMYSSPQLVLGSVVLNDSVYTGDLLSDSHSGSDTVETFTIVDATGKDYVYHLAHSGTETLKGANGYTYHFDLDNNKYYTTDDQGAIHSGPYSLGAPTATIVGEDGKYHTFLMNGDAARIDVGSGTLVIQQNGHYDFISNDGNDVTTDFSLNGSYTTTNGEEHSVEFTNDALTASDAAAAVGTSYIVEDSLDQSSNTTDHHSDKEHKDTHNSTETHDDASTSTTDHTIGDHTSFADHTASDSSLATSSSESSEENLESGKVEQHSEAVATSTVHTADEPSSSVAHHSSVESDTSAEHHITSPDSQVETSSQPDQATTDNHVEAQASQTVESSTHEDANSQGATTTADLHTSSPTEATETVEVTSSHSDMYDILNGEEGDTFYIKAQDSGNEVIHISGFNLENGHVDTLDLSSILDQSSLSENTAIDSLLSIEREGQDAHITIASDNSKGSETIVLENVYSQDIPQGEDLSDLILQHTIALHSNN